MIHTIPLPVSNGQRVSFGQTDGRGAILVRFTHFYSGKLRRTQTRWTDCLSETELRPSKSQSSGAQAITSAALALCSTRDRIEHKGHAFARTRRLASLICQ